VPCYDTPGTSLLPGALSVTTVDIQPNDDDFYYTVPGFLDGKGSEARLKVWCLWCCV
jgi:hypothetical protein